MRRRYLLGQPRRHCGLQYAGGVYDDKGVNVFKGTLGGPVNG